MRTPEGITYTFDYMTKRAMPAVAPRSGVVNGMVNGRIRVYLLATLVTDRYGNWVRYTYDAGGNLQTITSSDNRTITLSWSGSNVVSATANPTNPAPEQRRTVGYSYVPSTLGGNRLDTVTLGDASTWTFS